MNPKCQDEITQTAEADIREIGRDIALDSETSAGKWREELTLQIASLAKFPLRCPIISESRELGREYRHLIYGQYRTIFRVDSDRVIILRVIHGARLLQFP
jgi:plasmid stabilization system protein ParE